MRKRRTLWLLSALALFGLGAWLMSRSEYDGEPVGAPKAVHLPRASTHEDRQRASRRQTLPPLPPPPSPTHPPPQRSRDPVHVALAGKANKASLVMEANAVRHSPIGQLLVDCLVARDGGRSLAKLTEQSGIDPLQDIDRMALSDGVILVTGQFAHARWDSLLQGHERFPYGEHGQLANLGGGGKRGGETVGLWNDQMVLVGEEEQVRAALDRLEDRSAPDGGELGDALAYGEIYGVLSASELTRLLPPGSDELKQRLTRAAGNVELHLDTRHDVGLVADFRGVEGQDSTDLGKSFAAALALARLQAQAKGQGELAELLDFAAVRPGAGNFRLELALPLTYVEQHLREVCAGRGQDHAPTLR